MVIFRADTYQFGYFLRGTEPHAVLIKVTMRFVRFTCSLIKAIMVVKNIHSCSQPTAACTPTAGTGRGEDRREKSGTVQAEQKAEAKTSPEGQGESQGCRGRGGGNLYLQRR